MFCAIKSSRYEKLFSYSFGNTALQARFIQKIIVLQNSLSESRNFFMRTIGIKIHDDFRTNSLHSSLYKYKK